LIHVARRLVERVENRGGRGAQVGGVEDRQVARHDELLADAAPEFLVRRRGRRRQIVAFRPRECRRDEGDGAADGEKPGELPSIRGWRPTPRTAPPPQSSGFRRGWRTTMASWSRTTRGDRSTGATRSRSRTRRAAPPPPRAPPADDAWTPGRAATP